MHALSTFSCSFRSAISLFLSWKRCSLEVITNSPFTLILFFSKLIKRSLTFLLVTAKERPNSGNHVAVYTLKRSSAFVFTLLTFCPPAHEGESGFVPGPGDRTKDTSIWSSGTWMCCEKDRFVLATKPCEKRPWQMQGMETTDDSRPIMGGSREDGLETKRKGT